MSLPLVMVAVSMAALTDAGSLPTTRPSDPHMIECKDEAVGVQFKRPADWVVDKLPTNGKASIAFRQAPGGDCGSIVANMQIFMDEPGGHPQVDFKKYPSAAGITDETLTVDGVPARFTATRIVNTPPASEMLFVQFAKGSRMYSMIMSVPQDQHDNYVRLAKQICESITVTTGQS